MRKEKLKKRIAELEARIQNLEDRSVSHTWNAGSKDFPHFASWVEGELSTLKKQIYGLEKKTDPAAATTEPEKNG